jgi:hypothetical protein
MGAGAWGLGDVVGLHLKSVWDFKGRLLGAPLQTAAPGWSYRSGEYLSPNPTTERTASTLAFAEKVGPDWKESIRARRVWGCKLYVGSGPLGIAPCYCPVLPIGRIAV